MDAAQQTLALIQALTQAPKTLFGSSTFENTRGGSHTEQTMLSQTAVNALLQNMMEDDRGGFARVTSGARVPGMYNTTSQKLLANDLMARVASNVALASAPKVTTKEPTTVEKKIPGALQGDAGAGTAGLLGLAGVNYLLNKSGVKKKAGGVLDDFLGGLFAGGSGDSVSSASPIQFSPDTLDNMIGRISSEEFSAPANADAGDSTSITDVASLLSSFGGGDSESVASTFSDEDNVQDVFSAISDWVSGDFFPAF